MEDKFHTPFEGLSTILKFSSTWDKPTNYFILLSQNLKKSLFNMYLCAPWAPSLNRYTFLFTKEVADKTVKSLFAYTGAITQRKSLNHSVQQCHLISPKRQCSFFNIGHYITLGHKLDFVIHSSLLSMRFTIIYSTLGKFCFTWNECLILPQYVPLMPLSSPEYRLDKEI